MNIVFFLAILTAVIGSVSTIIEKHFLNKGIRFQTIIFWAFPVAAFVGLAYGLIYKDILKEDLKKMGMKDYTLLMSKMFFIILVSSTISYYILKRVPSYVHTALGTMGPVVTLILGVLLLKEKINWKQVIGIVLTVAGTYIISSNGKIEPHPILQRLKIETD
jgi:drug/metabolite transporter (DMT)-like permease